MADGGDNGDGDGDGDGDAGSAIADGGNPGDGDGDGDGGAGSPIADGGDNGGDGGNPGDGDGDEDGGNPGDGDGDGDGGNPGDGDGDGDGGNPGDGDGDAGSPMADGGDHDSGIVIPPNCGNGSVELPEVCDDSNNAAGDYCAPDCTSVTGACGDGTQQTNEACDDGNVINGDYCRADCELVTGVCGDEIRQTNEPCDDGNQDDGDYCAGDCQAITGYCGDGEEQNNELCDDGNQNLNDYCAPGCQEVTGACGDGIQQGNEACDDENVSGGDYCSADCLIVTGSCGDGEEQSNETCDDGNETGDDYCSADCQEVTGACGDTITQTNELCDDGNETGNDYCSVDCQEVTGRCGDLVIQENESCDDGYQDNCGTCNADCTGTGAGSTCGDGAVCPELEACDDGYADSCGDCNETCDGPALTASCGQGVDHCCNADQTCLSEICQELGDPCIFTEDCELDEICDPILHRCILREYVDVCEYVPPVGVLEPVVGCRWTPPPGDNRGLVVMTPAVADLTGDGIPEILFSGFQSGCCDVASTLYVVSGWCQEDGSVETIASIRAPVPNSSRFYDIDNSGGLSIADLDGDGVPEIVAMLNRDSAEVGKMGTIAFKRAAADASDWSVYWVNTLFPVRGEHTNGGTQPSTADLYGDGTPEVIIGNVVLNGQDGTLVWDGQDSTRPPGAGRSGIGNNAFLGPVSHVADIDLDGEPEIIAGNTVYSRDGTIEWTYDFSTTGSDCVQGLTCDGFTATGNFDDDEYGEVVIVRQGEVFVLSHDGQLETMADPNNAGLTLPLQADLPPAGYNTRNESGPPTVADFDGDGRAEIGTASAQFYVVVDFDCVGSGSSPGCDRSVQDPGGLLEEYVLWKTVNNDSSSRATGSSVFDFEGDGAAEVVYADEDDFLILAGSTGEVLFRDTSHGSNTRLEMPVIADVDNDGSAEVIVASTTHHGNVEPGVKIWDDANANWVRTRNIWNQHSYHVTNVENDGTIPLYEEPNWTNGRLNNFRQNVQPAGLFDAPDLTVREVTASCGQEFGSETRVEGCIANEGALAVPAGLTHSLVFDFPQSGAQLQYDFTTESPIFPGDCVGFLVVESEQSPGSQFELTVTADVDGTENGGFNECHEDNNQLVISGTCF
jgi:cysteine-rich repeat protein